jgi:hypothetical protein
MRMGDKDGMEVLCSCSVPGNDGGHDYCLGSIATATKDRAGAYDYISKLCSTRWADGPEGLWSREGLKKTVLPPELLTKYQFKNDWPDP